MDEPIRVNPSVTVEEITDLAVALAHAPLLAAALGCRRRGPAYHGNLQPRENGRSRTYMLAVVDGATAALAVGTYTDGDPILQLSGAATLPDYRGRGIYTALVARRLADARAAGREAAVIGPNRTTSAPICATLGFEELCGLDFTCACRRRRCSTVSGYGELSCI